MLNLIFNLYLGFGIGYLFVGVLLFILNPIEFLKFFDDGGKFYGGK